MSSKCLENEQAMHCISMTTKRVEESALHSKSHAGECNSRCLVQQQAALMLGMLIHTITAQ